MGIVPVILTDFLENLTILICYNVEDSVIYNVEDSDYSD